MTTRSHFRHGSIDLAVLARVMDNPAVSAIEIANHFDRTEGKRHAQRKDYGRVSYAAFRTAIRRCKLLGLIREGDPYSTGAPENDAKRGFRIPLYLTAQGKKVLDDHMKDIAGVRL